MAIFDKWIDAAVTVTPDTNIYAAGDAVGQASASAALIFDLTGSRSGGGLINVLTVADNDNEGAAGELWLFKADLATPITDNAAFAVAFADFANLITILPLPTFRTISSMKVAVLEDINTKFQVTQNRIYGYFVASGTPTYAAARSLRFQLGLLTQ